MSEMKHTEGPWDFWDMDEYGFHVFADKWGDRTKGQDCRLSIAAIRYGRSHDEAHENYFEAEANARLISAAPDMYQALSSIANTYDERWSVGSQERRIGDLARSVLAKAEGRQP